MNKYVTKQFLVLTLLVISLLAPAAYAQDQASLGGATQASAQGSGGRQTRFEAAPFIRTELYFGRNRSDGGEVSQEEFDDFLSEFITPRFPDGLTVIKARGQFLNSNGDVERERSVVLILLYPVAARREKQVKIEEIREEYVTRFKQQSVLRTDYPLPVWVSF
jgi:hypothetical protein